MNKDTSYGHWYPVKSGGMPEDLLGYKTFDKFDITEAVLIPHHWGNEHGGGEYYPACRMRKKGNKEWKWYPCNSAKPLFWMPIPHIPTKAGVAVYKKHYNEETLQAADYYVEVRNTETATRNENIIENIPSMLIEASRRITNIEHNSNNDAVQAVMTKLENQLQEIYKDLSI